MHHWTSVLKYFHIQSFPEQKRKLMRLWLLVPLNIKPKGKTWGLFEQNLPVTVNTTKISTYHLKPIFSCTDLCFSDNKFYLFYNPREKVLNMSFWWRNVSSYTICESNCALSIALTFTKASSTSITKLKTKCATTSSSPCQKKTEKCIHWEQVMHCIPKRVHQWTNYSGLKRRKWHTAVGFFSLVPECK